MNTKEKLDDLNKGASPDKQGTNSEIREELLKLAQNRLSLLLDYIAHKKPIKGSYGRTYTFEQLQNFIMSALRAGSPKEYPDEYIKITRGDRGKHSADIRNEVIKIASVLNQKEREALADKFMPESDRTDVNLKKPEL